jgi:MucB/RseB family protein
VRTLTLLALLSIASSAPAADRVPRVAVQAPDAVALPADLAGTPFPIAIRVVADLADQTALQALEPRIADYVSHGLRLWLATPTPPSESDLERWRGALQRWLRAHRTAVVILELQLRDEPRSLSAFAVRAAATDLRATIADARLAVSGSPVAADRVGGLITRELAAYVDLVALRTADAAERAVDALQASAPGMNAVVIDFPLPADPDTAAAAFTGAQAAALGTRVVSVCARGSGEAMKTAIRSMRPLASLLTGAVDVLDPATSSLSISGAPEEPPPTVARRLFFDNSTFRTFLYYEATRGDAPLRVSVNVPVEGTPIVFDLVRGSRERGEGYTRDGVLVHVQAPRTGRPMLIDFSSDATGEALASRTDVAAARTLSVDEIIARHRQQQAAQDAVLRHYRAAVRMEQHFRPTVTDPGYDVVTENRYFSSPDGVEWEETSFAVNGSKFGANRPPFPLLQPEKVLSLPLQLRFSDDYRYRLEGAERVDGYDCYVVRFDPLDATRSLYRGTVWIDRASFARIKVQGVQTHLSAPVVSNDEAQRYTAVTTVEGRPVFLLSALSARQIVMIAGRNLLVERTVAFSDFDVNGDDFVEARALARKGDHVMYRDTDRGLRYFVKRGDERVVSERPTSKAKAAAIGVTIDPSFAFPLPIVGLNYLNFSFRNPDTQFAMLFGGVLAAINVQRPKVPHTPFDASVDFFGIAVPSSDRRYDSAGEHADERVITWPLTTGLNLGWQYTPFQKATFQYQFRFDGYHRDTTTVDTFVVPSSTVTNGLGGAYEYRRGGYSAVLNGAWYARAAWHPWGLPDASQPDGGLETAERTYTKYSANLSRDFYLAPIQKIHLNGAYFGGTHLDRFSRYQFGLFDDTRIHGVPASGVRFDELAMARGSYTFDLLQLYRFDVFVEQAWGRDLTATHDWQRLTGLGVAFNVRAPFNTILRADIGHALLPQRYRGVGSTVVQVLLLKPLGS